MKKIPFLVVENVAATRFGKDVTNGLQACYKWLLS